MAKARSESSWRVISQMMVVVEVEVEVNVVYC
jgi:hypothetical protein